MAAPLTDDALLSALTNEGCAVTEWDGWRDSDRPGPFGPVHGIVIHHTGSDPGGSTGQGYVRDVLWPGRADLPGPLCTAGIGPDGTVWLLCNSDSNHAGGGDPDVLDAVIAEETWLMQREAVPHKGNDNGIDGNARFYGTEVMYSGAHAMSPAQHDAAVRFAAAICRAYGWTARSVIGHREWSDDKPDPGHCPMTDFRAAVQAQLDHPTTTVLSSTHLSTTDLKENTMPEPKDLWTWDGIPSPSTENQETNPTWRPDSYLRKIYEVAVKAQHDAAAALAIVTKLADHQG